MHAINDIKTNIADKPEFQPLALVAYPLICKHRGAAEIEANIATVCPTFQHQNFGSPEH